MYFYPRTGLSVEASTAEEARKLITAELLQLIKPKTPIKETPKPIKK